MKKKILALIICVFSTLASAATLNPIQLLNPAGSTAGQVIVSTGPSSAPSWSANFGPLNFASTGHFYQGQGGNVSRINDRLFIAGATANNGTQVASQPDWLTTFQLATGRTGGFIQLSSSAVLNGVGSENVHALVAGAQSQYVTIAGLNSIGITSVGVANNSSVASSTYAGYFETYRMSGSTGGAYGLEVDTVNYKADEVTDPYQQAGGETIAYQAAAGAGLSATGQYPAQAALNIQNNNSTFDAGIVIGSNAISGATGTSGTGVAIAMGIGHTIQWYGSAGVKTSGIFSTGTTSAAGLRQQFSDNQVQWLNGNSNPAFGINYSGSTVNYAQATAATTGGSPSIGAAGTDTNIALAINGKGTGGALLQGSTAGTTQTTGYVGEQQTGQTTGTSMTTGTTANCTSKSLGAGSWLVWGNVQFVPAGSTTVSQVFSGVSTTSATLPGTASFTELTASFQTGQPQVIPTPIVPLNLSATTTVYLVGQSAFGTSTMTCTGNITAVRFH